ncbi:MAG TPA: hypothetical protein VIP11_08205 [Gemmatimonadaceae bacterium]
MSSTLVAILLAATLQQGPDSVINHAREALNPLTDSAVLHKAGYFAIGFGGNVKDLSPFQGQHWLQVRQFLTNQPLALDKPNITIYLPVRDSLIPVGVAYTKRVVVNTPSPTDIGGVQAEWHVHISCRGIPGEGQVLADGVEDCLARGGDPAPNQITMVHAWTVPNPDGAYAHDNPALPFIALGLKTPSHFMRDERLFAVALGEAYGARLMTGALIERYTATAAKPHKLETYRATMRGLARELLAAEQKGDTKQYDAVRKRVLATWAVLADEYRAAAPTAQIRQRFDVELEQLLAGGHHHG